MDIIADEQYEELKDVKFGNYYNKRICIPALLLIFIRNYYSRGDGRDFWKSTPSLSSLTQKHEFLEQIANESTCQNWTVSELFPNGSSTDLRDWIKSQCWMLKVDDGKGSQSELLKNNARIYAQFNEFAPMVRVKLRCAQ